MMFTHDSDHPLYSTRWALSDWFQFSFENTVLSGRFASVLIKILFRISRVYQKSEENVDLTLCYDITYAHPVGPYNTITCCRFGNFIIHLPNIFTFMHLKCKLC